MKDKFNKMISLITKKPFIYHSVLVVIFLLLVHNQAPGANTYKRFTALQCDSIIKSNEMNPDFVVLDVRTFGEYMPLHIKGAINIDYYGTGFSTKISNLIKSKVYLIHCQSGGRSAGAFTMMQNQGFNTVYEMIGGFNSWNSQHLPVFSDIGPRLMLVKAWEVTNGAIIGKKDTFRITLTNRANDTLRFNSITLANSQECNTDFIASRKLSGSEDYTFSVFYTPQVIIADTLRLSVDSNAGYMNIKIPVKRGSIQWVDMLATHDVKIFPNPASSSFSINTEVNDLKVVDISGKTAFEERHILANKPLDVSALKNGVYMVWFRTGNEMVSKKIMVHHHLGT